MKSETKFYGQVKKNITKISWIRIENLAVPGTPDLLGYNNNGVFFTVELKYTKTNKVTFSPHQIAFHVKHSHNTFIIVQALGPRASKTFPIPKPWVDEPIYMFRGSQIRELASRGLELDACGLGLEDSIRYLLSI